MHFPDVQGESLAGQPCSFPRDFGGGRTIALVAFDLKQRADLETWIPFVDEWVRRDAVRGRLFAALPRSMRMMKGMIVATLRKDAPSRETREAMIPLFVDIDEFCASLGIADRRSIHIFVVESDGLVSARRQGPFTADAGTAIESAIS